MKTNPPLLLWLRLGDASDYESSHSIECSLLAECFQRGDSFAGWVEAGLCVAPHYLGQNYISLYWGDADANLVRELDTAERLAVERLIRRQARSKQELID